MQKTKKSKAKSDRVKTISKVDLEKEREGLMFMLGERTFLTAALKAESDAIIKKISEINQTLNQVS